MGDNLLVPTGEATPEVNAIPAGETECNGSATPASPEGDNPVIPANAGTDDPPDDDPDDDGAPAVAHQPQSAVPDDAVADDPAPPYSPVSYDCLHGLCPAAKAAEVQAAPEPEPSPNEGEGSLPSPRIAESQTHTTPPPAAPVIAIGEDAGGARPSRHAPAIAEPSGAGAPFPVARVLVIGAVVGTVALAGWRWLQKRQLGAMRRVERRIGQNTNPARVYRNQAGDVLKVDNRGVTRAFDEGNILPGAHQWVSGAGRKPKRRLGATPAQQQGATPKKNRKRLGRYGG